MTKPRPVTLRMGPPRANIVRLGDEADRRAGRLRDLVLRQLATGKDPAAADIAAALVEPAPRAEESYTVALTDEDRQALQAAAPGDVPNLPTWLDARITPERRQAAIAARQVEIDANTRVLCEYVARAYILGHPRRTGRKAPSRTLKEDTTIAAAYYRARDAEPRIAAAVTKARIAAEYDISPRTLERILRDVRRG